MLMQVKIINLWKFFFPKKYFYTVNYFAQFETEKSTSGLNFFPNWTNLKFMYEIM